MRYRGQRYKYINTIPIEYKGEAAPKNPKYQCSARTGPLHQKTRKQTSTTGKKEVLSIGNGTELGLSPLKDLALAGDIEELIRKMYSN